MLRIAGAGNVSYFSSLCGIKSEKWFYEIKRIIYTLIVKVKEKKMSNKRFWLGILVITLVFGISVVGCDNSSAKSNENEADYKGRDLAGNEYTLFFTENTARDLRSNQPEGDQGEDNNGGSWRKGGSFMMKIKPDEGEEVSASGTINEIIDTDTLILQTQDGSEFSVTIRDGIISSIVGEITLDDGTIFIVRTFDTIYLRSMRWAEGNGHGEGYVSGSSIKLSDIYTGNIDDLISTPFEEWCLLKISGNVDKEIKYLVVDVLYASYNGNDWNWKFIGGGYGAYAKKFGPGDFSSVVIQFCSQGVDTSALPDGEVILQLNNELFIADIEHPDWDRDNGERIPDDFPENGIWATFSNLTFEPVVIQ
jgi:hypothetical protein